MVCTFQFHLSEVEISFVFFVSAATITIISIPGGIIINRLVCELLSVLGLLIAAFGEFLLGMQEYAGIW